MIVPKFLGSEIIIIIINYYYYNIYAWYLELYT